jgi:membrane-associated phospholipid phosphatase
VLTTVSPGGESQVGVAQVGGPGPEGAGEATPASRLRRAASGFVSAVTTRMLPTEVLLGTFFVALVVLMVVTGQVSVVSYRLGQGWRFAAVVVGVALVIMARGYMAHPRGAVTRYGIDPGRARAGLAVAVRTLREFGPLFAFLAFYEALHDLTPVLRPIVEDHLLVTSDRFIFHTDVGRWLDDHFASVTMTQVMTFCYVTYAFAGPIYAGVQYFRGRFRAFHDFALAVSITAFIGYTGYMLLPAVGPYLYQHTVYADALPGWGHGGLLDMISRMKGSARDAFPSLHTAMTTVALGMMWRDARKLFWAYLPIGLGLYAATMYLRVHYATDVIAGFATAAVALWLAPKINRWWYARRERAVAAVPPHQRSAADESRDNLVLSG